MKAVLDHVGIAVKDLDAALRFYRDALGLEIEAPEDVASQRVRAHFVPVGESKLELLEATSPDSPIARYVEKRGAGLHHITLRVDDIAAVLAQVKARGARLVDEQPRPGAEGALVAFIHPSSAHGVLVELKQPAPRGAGRALAPGAGSGAAAASTSLTQRFTVGDLELISVSDGFFRLDGGAMFGIVPRALWASKLPPDDRNRVRLAMRPLVVRGVRTMIIDGGLGDKESAKFCDLYGVERGRHLDHALAEAGLRPDDIDIVLATHLHFDHAGGFTVRDERGRLGPRFPRARYVVRRGEWEDATHTHERNRGSYLPGNYLPLKEAGVLELVDEDQTIMPGVRVVRTGGHTMHHQMIRIESGGQRAVYPADLLPTSAHVGAAWSMGIDLHPVDTLNAKLAFMAEAARDRILVFLDHDPDLAAGHIVEEGGKFRFAAP
jgi:methylmalonyl-CoA epimerase